MLFSLQNSDEKAAATTIGVNPYFIKDYLSSARKYEYAGVERALLLLHQYNLRSIGVYDAGTSDAGLMKEMVVKMMN